MSRLYTGTDAWHWHEGADRLVWAGRQACSVSTNLGGVCSTVTDVIHHSLGYAAVTTTIRRPGPYDGDQLLIKGH